MRATPSRYSLLRSLLETYAFKIDAAYGQRIRRQCSREDFAEGYIAGLIDTMPIGTARPTETPPEHHVTPD